MRILNRLKCRPFSLTLRGAPPFWTESLLSKIITEDKNQVPEYISSICSFHEALGVTTDYFKDKALLPNKFPGISKFLPKSVGEELMDKIHKIAYDKIDISFSDLEKSVELMDVLEKNFPEIFFSFPFGQMLVLMDKAYTEDFRFLEKSEQIKFVIFYLKFFNKFVRKQIHLAEIEDVSEKLLTPFFRNFKFLNYLLKNATIQQPDISYWQNFKEKISTNSFSDFANSLIRFFWSNIEMKKGHILIPIYGSSEQLEQILKLLTEISIILENEKSKSEPLITRNYFDLIKYFWNLYTHQLYFEIKENRTEISNDRLTSIENLFRDLEKIRIFNKSHENEKEFLKKILEISKNN